MHGQQERGLNRRLAVRHALADMEEEGFGVAAGEIRPVAAAAEHMPERRGAPSAEGSSATEGIDNLRDG